MSKTIGVLSLCAGMDETGIYRVSGVTSDVQKLKKYFDKSKPLFNKQRNKTTVSY